MNKITTTLQDNFLRELHDPYDGCNEYSGAMLPEIEEAAYVTSKDVHDLASAAAQAKKSGRSIQLDPSLVLSVIARLARTSTREVELRAEIKKVRSGDKDDVLVYPPRKVDPFKLTEMDGAK